LAGSATGFSAAFSATGAFGAGAAAGGSAKANDEIERAARKAGIAWRMKSPITVYGPMFPFSTRGPTIGG
jgi:hypothetical protein